MKVENRLKPTAVRGRDDGFTRGLHAPGAHSLKPPDETLDAE